MRMPLNKIWRAFPELDRFDDERCMVFVKLAQQRRGYYPLLLGVFLLSLVSFCLLTATSFWLLTDLLGDRFDTNHPRTYALLVIAQFSLSGGVALVAGYLIRDMILRRAIKHHLVDARCRECSYPLLGLTVRDGCVTCPECGTPFRLDDYGMTPDDLIAT